MSRPVAPRFEWVHDHAVAPDGTRYGVFSEHVRGERRWYSPKVYRPRSRPTGLGGKNWESAGDGAYDIRTARRQAERHWFETTRAGREGEPLPKEESDAPATEWKEIVRALERAVRAEDIAAVTLDLAERWEREARDRVMQALVDGMGAQERFDRDPHFHRAIHAIAQIAAFAIFDKPLVTDAERQARRADFDTFVLSRGFDPALFE